MSDHSHHRRRTAGEHRLLRMREQGMRPPIGSSHERDARASIDCGWGRLIFANTFDTPEELADTIRAEGPDRRDIAFYVRDPHVAVAAAPLELFLDPSHTYRLNLSTYRPSRRPPRGFFVRRLSTQRDAEAVNIIYAARDMVPVPPDFFWARRDARALVVLVAEDSETGAIVGSVMGVDHRRAFDDPERGSSLWCLAVSPQAPHSGIGEALVRRLAEHFKTRQAAYMDLSVFHDNEQAIALYEKLGFRRVPVFAIKRKNPINEPLYAGPATDQGLNPYAKIIVDEARRRGIFVEVLDAAGGFFQLTFGGRSVRCRESLSEFTTAVAMSICDDKAAARRIVESAGVQIPAQISAGDRSGWAEFLAEHGSVVVKPARGEQGRGISIGLTTVDEVAEAVEQARAVSHEVLIEEEFKGEDLRLVVIDYKVIAAATRRSARVIGDGRTSIADLIEKQSRRRSAATGGESHIPIDAETERCLAEQGYALDSVLPAGKDIAVRKTANLHTGGTIHDVTDMVHPRLAEAAVAAASAIAIPVTGIDLMVKDPTLPDYVFIEANERPGLANHEPQPTAERFVDLLFPLSIPQAARTIRQRSPA